MHVTVSRNMMGLILIIRIGLLSVNSVVTLRRVYIHGLKQHGLFSNFNTKLGLFE